MQLYVYKGAGCTGRSALPSFETFIGRKVDGVVDFIDYTNTWSQLQGEASWAIGCWAGDGRKLALSVPLSVANYQSQTGSSQFADIAAGRMDSYYTLIATSLVAHGFANAQIRLGWEENGSWYPWSAAKNPAQFQAAFAHVYALFKATPGSAFTVWFNPTLGYQQSQPSTDFPGVSHVDGMAWDVYANTWGNPAATTEPALYNGMLTQGWGINAIGTGGFYGQLPAAVPEFGVGSRGDGHGAPDGSVANGGDDPLFMTNALKYFVSKQVRLIGYWDYNAGDYKSMISDGSRPKEATAFLEQLGTMQVQAALAGVDATAPSSFQALVSRAASIVYDKPDGSHVLLWWAPQTSNAVTYQVTFPGQRTLSIVQAQNGGTQSTWRGVSFPWTTTGGMMVLTISGT